MSINVNVTGNPICIKRGKMVTADPDFATREFQKRRRTRLEQVRQQSKDIAANVRNKVRREKDKQLSDIERLGAKELQKWQARKLLNLQQQYRDCLNDIGLGHAQAVIEEESEEALAQQQENYEYVRQERGKEAMQRVKNDLNKAEEDKIDCNERRRYNRAVENARSSLVTHIVKSNNKSPFKVKKKKKINKNDITLDSSICESGSEMDVPLNTFNSEKLSTPIILNKMDDPLDISDKEVQINLLPTDFQEVESAARENVFCPVDTRISDRIKRRRRYRPPIYDLTNEPTLYKSGLDNGCQRVPNGKFVDKGAQTSFRETTPTYRVASVLKDSESNNKHSEGDLLHAHSELPSKPKLTLKVNEVYSTETSKLFSGHKVQYYDHNNRFSKEYEAPVSSVQRVNEDSIEVCASVGSEAEFVDTMYKRDKDALVRGQRALEKVKAHQDYKEIMEQLPRLQKKERLASLSVNKPEFHMSGDRLKENERKRQNRIENAYEKLFPQTQIITIPSKQTSKGNISNLQGDQNIKAMGTWDIDKPSSSSVISPRNVESCLLKRTSEKLLNDSNESTKRKESLQKMLKSLTEHRNKLANELKSIPQTSNLHRVLGDLSTIDEVIESGRSLDKETIKESRTHDAKGTKVPSKVSTPKPGRRVDTQSSKKSTKEVPASPVPKPKPITASDSKTQQSIGKRKAPTGSSSVGYTGEQRVHRYKCKYIPKSREQSPSSRTTSPASVRNQSPESSPSRSQSPLDKCICRRPKDHPPDEKCKCKEFYKSKPQTLVNKKVKNSEPPKITSHKGNLNKVDVGVEASAHTVDKGVSTASVNKNKKGQEDDKECVCGTTVKPFMEACEIVIKICDEGKHKISVSPTRQCAEKSESDSSSNNVKTKFKLKPHGNTTWRECFSQNSNNSTSTSYYSPPEILTTSKTIPGKHTSTTKTILKNKPQQRNLNDSSVVFAPRKLVKLDDRTLLKHIKQLLSMSRGSVDELGVSTVSDVSTPGSSVINIESNCGDDRFEHFLKHLNIDLSQLPSATTVPNDKRATPPCYNTAVSTIDSSSTAVQSCSEDDTRNKTIDEYATENYPDVLLAYNKMAENCAQKIDNLASMIENVRLQRTKLYRQNPIIDKDNSTRYYELPSTVLSKACDCVSPEQQKLNEQLLQVEPDLENEEKAHDTSTDGSSTNQELLDRFNKLKEYNAKQNCNNDINVSTSVTTSAIWLDIPRLPIYTVPQICSDANNITRTKSKPPTSKGITVARCYNKDINVLPHELSEIPEVDSFISGNLQRTPNTNRFPSNELLNIDTLTTVAKATQKDNSVYISDPKNSSSSMSIPDILSGIDSPIQIINAEVPTTEPVEPHLQDKVTDTLSLLSQKTLVSDSSTNDMETIETTLKRLGMGWAVTTIKKTQEALALTSTSSSSIDITPVHSISKNENNGTSLNQISVETLCSSKESSISALSIFLQGLVDTTQNPDSGSSANKTSRKTSTPVQTRSYREEEIKSSVQPNIILTAESDISSIKQSSNDNGYDYIPFYSLNEATANQTKEDTNQ